MRNWIMSVGLAIMLALAFIAVLARPPLGSQAPSPSTEIIATPSPAPTVFIRPTPAPTVVLGPMTPVPTGVYSGAPGTPPPPAPLPTTDPSAPFDLVVQARRASSPQFVARQAEVIVTGTVRQVMPARWTTVNGQRPSNPHALTESIFTPVLIEVETYLKGQQQLQLLLYAPGGRVGQDVIRYEPNDFTFRNSERVIMYLTKWDRLIDNKELWNIIDRYTISSNGQAVNSQRELPLQQLRVEIHEAGNP
jgi:hypothetical protein